MLLKTAVNDVKTVLGCINCVITCKRHVCIMIYKNDRQKGVFKKIKVIYGHNHCQIIYENNFHHNLPWSRFFGFLTHFYFAETS